MPKPLSFRKLLLLAAVLFIFLAIICVSAANIFIKSSFIDRSRLAVAKAVQFEGKDLGPEDFSLTNPDHAKNVFNDFYDRIKTDEIIRIKVWDYSGKVIFSDDQSIVGQRFPENEEFQQSIKGNIITEIGQKMKPENVAESGYEQLLEVYVPITFGGESVPSGVIEAYYKLDEVNHHMQQTMQILTATVIAFTFTSLGLLLVVFRLFIYPQALKNLRQAIALDNASDHIIITDPDGIILFANQAAEKLTGYTKAEMVGNRPSLWGKQMPSEFYQQMWHVIKTEKKTFRGEITNLRKDGTSYDAKTEITPVLDENNRIIYFVGIERDITAEKAIDQAKTEFVSLASHQLRTPISTINWYTEMLLSQDAGKINSHQKEYLQESYKAGQRMVDLINALLNVSRLEMGTFVIEPQPTDIIKIAKTCLGELKRQITAKKLVIRQTFAPNIPSIPADPKLLSIIFGNLLNNAVKYTPNAGSVNLSIDRQKDAIVITIADTGLGIPRAQQDKIFTKLFRADNAHLADTEGTGLGLYIVKSILDHSGGKIRFESEEGGGTTFYVTLPLEGMQKKTGTKKLA